VAASHAGVWGARADFDSDFAEVEVVVATPVTSAEIKVEPLTSGEEGNVTCLIHGGRPQPSVSLSVDGMDAKHRVTGSQEQMPEEDGSFETTEVRKEGQCQSNMARSDARANRCFLYCM